ncbi:MAG: DUF3341 domain-containing protein [Acidobacteria bacterium]|nr:DUF3341 domain-containing protein [Acidobacteriota bacterium]
MFLTGEFSQAEATGRAIEALKAKGFGPQALDMFSTEPVELPPGVLDRPSRMSLMAVAGAVVVCLLAVVFVYYTQRSYRLNTGGMPLFSLWATGVIFYEMAVLGAIGATFVMFLWESGMLRKDHAAPRWKGAEGELALEPGRILLRVRCEPEHFAAVGECLYAAGASRVEKVQNKS